MLFYVQVIQTIEQNHSQPETPKDNDVEQEEDPLELSEDSDGDGEQEQFQKQDIINEISKKTLVMYYWACAVIGGKPMQSKVQHQIVEHLNQQPNLDLRTVGVIAHARKYYEKRKLKEGYKKMISDCLDRRLSQPSKYQRVSPSDLVHLKLIA